MTDLADTEIESEVRSKWAESSSKAKDIVEELERMAELQRGQQVRGEIGEVILTSAEIANLAQLLRLSISAGDLEIWVISDKKKNVDKDGKEEVIPSGKRTLFALGNLRERFFCAGFLKINGTSQERLDIFEGRVSGPGEVLLSRNSIANEPLFPQMEGVRSTEPLSILIHTKPGQTATLIENGVRRVELTALHIKKED